MRFPEFTDEWKEYKISELTDNIIDFRGKTPKKLGFKWGGNIPALSAINVKMGKIELNEETHYGSIGLYNKWMTQGDCEKDDVIITMEAPLGNVAQIPDDKKYILSQRVVLFKFKNFINKNFIAQYFRSNKFQKELLKLSTGTTAKGIKQKNLVKIKVKIPSYLEQKKDANILSLIDQKIDLLEKRLILNERIIRSISNSLFKDLDIKNSEISTLKKICTINKGEQLNKDNMTLNGKYYVLNGGKEPSGYTDKWNVEKNTISISEGGNCGYVNFNFKEFWAGGHCYYLTDLNKNIKLYYLYYYLKENQREIMKLRVGSALFNIQKKDIENFKIKVPKIEKQKEISHFLLILNRKLEIIKSKLKLMKVFKRGLLQEMFV